MKQVSGKVMQRIQSWREENVPGCGLVVFGVKSRAPEFKLMEVNVLNFIRESSV